MLVEIKRFGRYSSSTKKYSYKTKVEKFDSILRLQDLIYLKFLKGSLLLEASFRLFDYRIHTIPHIIIRVPKWRKFFNPRLISTTIPYTHLRAGALYTKITLNANIIEAILRYCYSKYFRRKLNFNSKEFQKFLLRPRLNSSCVLNFQWVDLYIAQVEKSKRKTLTLILYANIFTNIDSKIKHILHVYGNPRTRCEFLCF